MKAGGEGGAGGPAVKVARDTFGLVEEACQKRLDRGGRKHLQQVAGDGLVDQGRHGGGSGAVVAEAGSERVAQGVEAQGLEPEVVEGGAGLVDLGPGKDVGRQGDDGRGAGGAGLAAAAA